MFRTKYSLYVRDETEPDGAMEIPNPRNWTIQVLRSIGTKTCKFSDAGRVQSLNISKYGEQIDDSIYRTLIWKIRNARR